MLKAWFSSFLGAWNLLVEIPLPFEAGEASGGDLADANRLIASFPLVGFVLALLFWLFISLMSVFFGETAKIVVSSIVIALAIEFVGGGRNLTSLGNMFAAIFSRNSSRSLFQALEDTKISGESLGILATISLFMLRVSLIGATLGYGFSSWIFAVMCGSFAVQSIFSTSRSLDSGSQFVDGDSRGIFLSCAIATFASVLPGNGIYATVISFLIVFAIFATLKSHLENRFGGVSAQLASSAGTASELLLWILGLTMIARS